MEAEAYKMEYLEGPIEATRARRGKSKENKKGEDNEKPDASWESSLTRIILRCNLVSLGLMHQKLNLTRTPRIWVGRAYRLGCLPLCDVESGLTMLECTSIIELWSKGKRIQVLNIGFEDFYLKCHIRLVCSGRVSYESATGMSHDYPVFHFWVISVSC